MTMTARPRAGTAPARAPAVLLAALAAAAMTASGCGGGGSAGPRAPGARGAGLRLILPAIDGGEVDTARYRGEVVVLHLFDSSSGPAQRDASELEALHRKYPDRVRVIGIDLDRDGTAAARAWRRVLGLDYLLTVAPPAVRAGQSPLGPIRAVPTTVVLDTLGMVAHRIERPLAEGEIARLVTPLLPEASPALHR